MTGIGGSVIGGGGTEDGRSGAFVRSEICSVSGLGMFEVGFGETEEAI